jgi:hypothetical protein
MAKAIALFSGGLDSILAAELIRRQNIDVICLTFTTPFFSVHKAQSAIGKIGLPLIVQDITTEHLHMLKSPRYGYGKNMNPCIDCHSLMLKIAGQKMEETGSDFIVTGEVLGQRPMSQNKQSLYLVAKNSGYYDYILRPLSARLLDPIKAERENLVNRSLLLSIQGRGRKSQIKLASEFFIDDFSPPAGGCLLTDSIFSRRLRDLFLYHDDKNSRDFELLKYGRHFRINDKTKVIVGRNNADNEALKKLIREDDWIFFMAKYPGPFVLMPYGKEDDQNIAASLCIRYSDAPDHAEAEVVCQHRHISKTILSRAASKEYYEKWLIC